MEERRQANDNSLEENAHRLDLLVERERQAKEEIGVLNEKVL